MTTPIRILVPPSKSFTHRAMVTGALAAPGTVIQSPLWAEDTQLTAKGLEALGVQWAYESTGLRVQNVIPPSRPIRLFAGNSGTTVRFLTALAALLSAHEVQLDGTPRMRQRPLQPLLSALEQMGAQIRSTNGFLPISIVGGSLRPGRVVMPGHISSQFLSALLFVAARLSGTTLIELSTPLVSAGYLRMTQWFLEQSGVEVSWQSEHEVMITSDGAPLPAQTWTVERDWSAAAFWIVGALIAERPVILPQLQYNSLQSDSTIVELLQNAGASLQWNGNELLIDGSCQQGIDVSLRNIPDLFPALAVYAACAHTPSRFRDFQHLRWKESDRIKAVVENLQRIGAQVVSRQNEIIITPANTIHPATIRTYNDHRIAMAFGLLKLRNPHIQLDDPACVRKSYPEFWKHRELLTSSANVSETSS